MMVLSLETFEITQLAQKVLLWKVGMQFLHPKWSAQLLQRSQPASLPHSKDRICLGNFHGWLHLCLVCSLPFPLHTNPLPLKSLGVLPYHSELWGSQLKHVQMTLDWIEWFFDPPCTANLHFFFFGGRGFSASFQGHKEIKLKPQLFSLEYFLSHSRDIF